MTAASVTTPTTTPVAPWAARPSLVRLTVVELRKLADTRAGYWLLIVIGLAAAALVTVPFFVADPAERTVGEFFGISLVPSTLLLPVLGILSVTAEWSQRTTLVTFALVPVRHRVAIAKLAAGALAAVASVLVSLVAATAGTLVADLVGEAHWKFSAWTLGYVALAQVIGVLMGFAFGMLLLNSPLAIVLYLALPTAWSLLGETISGLRRAAGWLDTNQTTAPLWGPDVTAGEWARIGVSVLVWVLLPLAAGLVRLTRQEVS